MVIELSGLRSEFHLHTSSRQLALCHHRSAHLSQSLSTTSINHNNNIIITTNHNNLIVITTTTNHNNIIIVITITNRTIVTL